MLNIQRSMLNVQLTGLLTTDYYLLTNYTIPPAALSPCRLPGIHQT